MAKKAARKKAKKKASKKRVIRKVAKKGKKKTARKGAKKKAAKKKKKARRTVMYSSAGKKLYAKRAADGSFKDIQSYQRAHSMDIKRQSAAEAQSSG